MPSPSQTSVDLPIEVFGGLVTQFDAQKLPMGASPFNQDVSFATAGGPRTRPGMLALYAAFAGNPTVNYVKTFADTQANYRQLSLDALGTVRQEFPPAVLTAIGSVVPGSYIQSDTLDGREWMAVGDGAYGLDIPRQWNGLNFDRVSQAGPGQSPTVVDEIAVYNIAASPNGLLPLLAGATNIVSQGGLVTFTFVPGALPVGLQPNDVFTYTGAANALYNVTYTIATVQATQITAVSSSISGTLPATNGGTAQFELVAMELNPVAIPFQPGRALTIAGAANATYNGTWTVRAVDATNTFMYLAVSFTNQAASGGGTATAAGNISAGLHEVSVLFVTETEFFTCPAVPNSWIASGNKRAVVSNIPTGPSNVIARIIIFTPAITAPATSGPFFYFSEATEAGSVTFPSMMINDNVTTTATFDFLDAVLENATAATAYFNRLELGECSGVCAYSDRTFWTGERNKVNSAGGGGGFINLGFDGGWGAVNGGFAAGYPLGWQQNYSVATQGSRAPAPVAYWGDAFSVTYVAGSGLTTGMIFQPAGKDYLGVPIIAINTGYSARVRLKTFTNLPANTFVVVEIFSPSQGSIGKLSIAANTIPLNAYKEFIGVLMQPQAVLPADIQLRYYLSGIFNVGDTVVADCLEPFPTLQPFNQTIVRCSFAEDPEAFDSESGLMVVGLSNGQSIRSMFWLLDNKLYMAKERSLYGTNDDGQNEPDLWTISTISQTVGTPSVNGTSGKGETWGIIASHDGAYIFDGTIPKKICQEIQPTWNTINWAKGTTIYTAIDTTNRRMHFGAPVNSAATPNVEFVLDYAHLDTAEDIVAHPQAYYSAYQPTKIIAPGRARKWTLWNLQMNSAAITQRADGSYHLLRGNGGGTGKVYDQSDLQFSDDGAAINFQYQTYFMPETEQEEALQLGSHRKHFKYLTGYAWGSGIMFFTVTGPQGQRQKPLSSLILRNPDHWDFEMNAYWVGERFSLIFGVVGQPGAWGELTKLCPTIQRELVTPVRGVA